jgi:spore maturation protein CgeB
MGCCVVSNPYLGIEEWFDIGKEMFVVHSQTEATELYRKLLIDDDLRRTVGDAARVRVRNEHTNLHRGQQILEILKHLS